MRYDKLDVDVINAMAICGSVTPSVLNTILVVNAICNENEVYRYVYIYQEFLSFLHLFELEVAPSKLGGMMHLDDFFLKFCRYAISG